MKELEFGRVAFKNKETRDQIIAACVRDPNDTNEAFSSLHASTSNVRLASLLKRSIKDSGFTLDETNITLIASAQHILDIRNVVDAATSEHEKKELWENGWELVCAAKIHAEEFQWHASLRNELDVLRSIVQLRRSIVFMEHSLKQGRVTLAKNKNSTDNNNNSSSSTNSKDVNDVNTNETKNESHNHIHTSELGINLSSINVQILDDALRFAIEAQTNVSHRDSVHRVLHLTLTFCAARRAPAALRGHPG